MAKAKRNKKGQFMKGGRKTRKRRGRSNPRKSTKGGRRVTARRAYMKTAAPRRRGRRNQPTNKELTSVVLWAALTALGQGYVRGYLAKATNSPQAASYGTVAAVGALGWWLTRKARTRPAGYAVLGVAFAQLTTAINAATGLFPESGAGFLPRSQVMQRLPRRVSIPSMNPVGRIVVPA